MATHDYVIANASGSAVRADLNNALAAIVSNNSNATEPATKYAYQWWADTNAGILKFRNAANDAWIDIIQLDGEYTTIGLENGSAAAPSLFFKDSGTDTGLLSPGADKVAISTGGVQRLTVDDSGRTLVGADSTLATSGHNSRIQVQGTNTDTSSLSLTRHSDDTGGARLLIGKSRAASVGGTTAIQENDTTGQIDFVGADGTDMGTRTAIIRSQVDGTPGSNDMPGRLVFETTNDGSTNPDERMRIDKDGKLLINTTSALNTSSSALLQIRGTTSNRNPSVTLVRNDTAVVATNNLGNLEFWSNDGGDASASECAQIHAEATQTHTADNRGTSLRFLVTKDGTNTPFEAMELDEDGRLRVYTSVNNALNLRTASTAGGNTGLSLLNGATSVDSGGSTCFRVMCDGDVENTNNNYGAISDVKLKENIVDAGSQWADLKALRVRKFNFKEETGNGTDTHIGLIAQEVELVSPGLVKDTTDIEEYQDPVLDSEGNPVLDDDGNPIVDTKERETGEVTKTVGYSVLYMKAVKALQEAMERIEQLETKVAALEGGAS
jgi:hypothetical protein